MTRSFTTIFRNAICFCIMLICTVGIHAQNFTIDSTYLLDMNEPIDASHNTKDFYRNTTIRMTVSLMMNEILIIEKDTIVTNFDKSFFSLMNSKEFSVVQIVNDANKIKLYSDDPKTKYLVFIERKE